MSGNHRLALTLLEILAVIVLLGLVAMALNATGLLRSQPRLARAEAISALRAFEHRVRLEAIGAGGYCRVTTTGMYGEVGWPTSRPRASWSEPLPAHTEVLLLVDGHPSERLIYDARGRSVDAEIVVTGFGAESRLHLAGLTGTWVESTP